MIGVVVFILKFWLGLVFDVEIIRNFGLIYFFKKGDVVMVDKGFIYIFNDLKCKGVKFYCLFFKLEFQFSRSEVEIICRIVFVRIYVECKMEQIKNFRILQGIMFLVISDFVD